MQPRPLGEDMDYSADVQVKPHVLMFQLLQDKRKSLKEIYEDALRQGREGACAGHDAGVGVWMWPGPMRRRHLWASWSSEMG